MNLDEYLGSERAVHDVGQAVAAFAIGLHPAQGCIEVYRAQAWTAVDHLGREHGHGPIHAYFRPEGDRYIVTDLGEAVRALRLRTGRLDPCGPVVAAEQARAAGALYVGETVTAWNVPAADLPRAICRVLLAAHRVASLEVP